jgi:hypothetical protein
VDACVHASLVTGTHIDDVNAPLSLPIDQCYYEAYTRLYVIKALNLPRSFFNVYLIAYPSYCSCSCTLIDDILFSLDVNDIATIFIMVRDSSNRE